MPVFIDSNPNRRTTEPNVDGFDLFNAHSASPKAALILVIDCLLLFIMQQTLEGDRRY